jgi:hypothetical protein
MRPYPKITKAKESWDTVQVIKYLPRNYEDLSLNPIPPK